MLTLVKKFKLIRNWLVNKPRKVLKLKSKKILQCLQIRQLRPSPKWFKASLNTSQPGILSTANLRWHGDSSFWSPFTSNLKAKQKTTKSQPILLRLSCQLYILNSHIWDAMLKEDQTKSCSTLTLNSDTLLRVEKTVSLLNLSWACSVDIVFSQDTCSICTRVLKILYKLRFQSTLLAETCLLNSISARKRSSKRELRILEMGKIWSTTQTPNTIDL